MRNDVYPPGTVKALLNSDDVNPQTKKVLLERLRKTRRSTSPFFDDESFALLEAVCDVLFPQEGNEKVPLAILYEEELATGNGNGWRYRRLPPLKTAITTGLRGIEEEAQKVHQRSFRRLSTGDKEALLTNVQQGKGLAQAWQGVPSGLFFEELLASLTGLYYAHPVAKEVIGDVSFSDAKGWTHLGLNNPEAREPLPVKKAPDATP